MGQYEDLMASTVEAILDPGQPMTLTQIGEALTRRGLAPRHHIPAADPMDLARVLFVLTSRPDRFLEVAPGVWVRRSDGPEAGVASRRPRHPLAGGAAAMVVPSPRPSSVEAVARAPLAAG
jgi:hypothetical protein